MIRRPSRVFADVSFWIVLIVGTAIFAAAAYGALRGTVGVVELVRSGAAGAASCSCLGTAVIQTPSVIGLGLGGGLAAAYLLAVIARGAAVARRTQRTVRRLEALPPSNRFRSATMNVGLAARGIEVRGAEADVFCVGYFRPRILVARATVELLDEYELTATLMHEQEHLLRRDPLRILLVDALTWPLRAIPWVRGMVDELRSAIELAADEPVVATEHGRGPLSGALLKLLEAHGGTGETLALTRFSPTERRIDSLLDGRPYHRRRIVLAFSAVGLALMVSVGLLVTTLGTNAARAADLPVGLCREARRICAAPDLRSVQPSMSTVPFQPWSE